MDLGLQGDAAVVVGGAKGIGRAIVEAFAAEKAQVALLDVDPAVEAAAREIAAAHQVDALGLIVDATQFESLQDAATAIARRWPGAGRHLVYAAGAGSGKYGFPFWNLAPRDWPRVLEVNLLGAVNAAHAFVGAMTEAKRGTMLFISSIAGQIGSPTDPPYSAAKAALINFAQCAAKDLAPYNVRVNTICPGMVKTSVNRSVWQAWHDQQPPDKRLSYEQWTAEKIARLVPLGRWQEAEDVAALAVFLASSRSKNTTGQTMNVDGGHVMHW